MLHYEANCEKSTVEETKDALRKLDLGSFLGYRTTEHPRIFEFNLEKAEDLEKLNLPASCSVRLLSGR